MSSYRDPAKHGLEWAIALLLVAFVGAVAAIGVIVAVVALVLFT